MIEIIPAIDLIAGKCVRLTQGDFRSSKIYSENPLEMAKQFEAIGVRRLHVVDLDGAKSGRINNLHVLEDIAGQTNLQIDFGGGVKTHEDVRTVFAAGAKFVSVGSIAAKEPETLVAWLHEFGSEKFLLGADVHNRQIAINGWQTATDIEIIPFLRNWLEIGLSQVFCTDISRDGLLNGPSNELYEEICAKLPTIKLIASGGVSHLNDFEKLENAGCSGVIVGKAIYENKILLTELRQFIKLNS